LLRRTLVERFDRKKTGLAGFRGEVAWLTGTSNTRYAEKFSNSR
jgi:hypothetical protein